VQGLKRLAPSFPAPMLAASATWPIRRGAPASVNQRRPVRTQGELSMNRPKTAAKTNKTAKAKAKSLKVKTSVKAGGYTTNRCEFLRRMV
jgi:hypothetical protein